MSHWNALNELENHHVVLKGFILQDSQGQWVLCQDPHIKSCCLGKQDLGTRQVLLEGFCFASSRDYEKVVAIEGLCIKSTHKPYLFCIENPSMRESQSYPLGTASICVLFVLFCVFFGRKFLKKIGV